MIYTAITNGYDKPREDIKCFTEYNKFKDNRLNAKIYKCLPHMFMPEAKWWIWIDGNLTLKDGALKELIELAGDSEVMVFANPYRKTVGEEMEEIVRLRLDDSKTVMAQTYNKSDKLPACFLIMRRNTPRVQRMNERWWSLICTGSVRDQISFSTAYSDIKYLDKPNPFDNEYFKRSGHNISREMDSRQVR